MQGLNFKQFHAKELTRGKLKTSRPSNKTKKEKNKQNM